jgi:hypothetical protein
MLCVPVPGSQAVYCQNRSSISTAGTFTTHPIGRPHQLSHAKVIRRAFSLETSAPLPYLRHFAVGLLPSASIAMRPRTHPVVPVRDCALVGTPYRLLRGFVNATASRNRVRVQFLTWSTKTRVRVCGLATSPRRASLAPGSPSGTLLFIMLSNSQATVASYFC